MAIRILCIGGGNMARAIFKGVFNHAPTASQIACLHIINPHDVLDAFEFVPAEKLKYSSSFAQLMAEEQTQTNFDLVILAIKPQILPEIIDDWLIFKTNFLEKTSDPSTSKPFYVLSILAGVSVTQLSQSLAIPINHIIRAMPNTPLSVGLGSTALFKEGLKENFKENLIDSTTSTTSTPLIKYEDLNTLQILDFVEALFKSSGQTCWLEDEELMHAYTALCASSPAYFFHILEVMVEEAMHLGFEPSIQAHIIQAMKGACTLAQHNPELSLAELKAQVTSKGGTTAAALAAFADTPSLEEKIIQGLDAAQKRSKELARLAN